MEHPNNRIEQTAKKIHVIYVKASLYYIKKYRHNSGLFILFISKSHDLDPTSILLSIAMMASMPMGRK